MTSDFDIRNYPDLIETLNLIIRSGNIAEVKVEKRVQPTCVEISRKKKYPPNK